MAAAEDPAAAAFDDSGAVEKAEGHKEAGNALLAKGDYADACQEYDKGLLAIVRVDGSQEQAASDARLALHLNASLAHLRRGNLGSAVEHASGALAVDPKSVKALYRRGSARARLAEHPGHEADGALARKDLERALELDPKNTEVISLLKSLRGKARAEQKELDRSQRDTFKGMFASGKAIYEDAPSPEEPAAVIGESGADSHRLVLSAEDVSFSYVRNEPVLQGAKLELHAGWSVGLFGNNASGKTTLARLLDGQHGPNSGRVVHHGEKAEARRRNSLATSLSTLLSSALATIGVGLLAVLFGLAAGGEKVRNLPKMLQWWHWAIIAGAAAVVIVSIKLVLDQRAAKKGGVSTVHVSSDTSDKEDIKQRTTIEKVIGEKLPSSWKSDEKRKKVIAMLRAGGFQMYNQATGEPVGNPEEYVRDGLEFGQLSGGQRHLIYILRCIASNPDVLLCDELLGGLDAIRQPRVLHMIRRMQREVGTAILFIACELHQLKLASDCIGFMHKGKICELGPTDEVLDFPKHPATKDYVSTYKSMPGCHRIGGKLAENFYGVEKDEDLAGDWLPI